MIGVQSPTTAHQNQLHFVVLDPRKQKRKLIARVLSPLGSLQWMRLPPIRLTGYSETNERSIAATAAARTQLSTSIFANLQRKLYALQYNGSRYFFQHNPEAIGVAWNGLNGSRRAFMDGARDAGAKTLYFELSPFKGRVTCDPKGVNFANSLPRTIEPYLDWMASSDIDSQTWKKERSLISQRMPRRSREPAEVPGAPDGPYLFAPLQVPGDSQLRLFGGEFRTVPDFLEALVAAADHLPKNWHLRIKEHPTAQQSFAHLITGRSERVFLDNVSDTFDLVAKSSGVVTVNSSVGLEAMFFDKPVVACGQCFWAIPGVALAATSVSELCQLMAKVNILSYDTTARNAFISFLMTIYYIMPDRSASRLVFNRLNSNNALQE